MKLKLVDRCDIGGIALWRLGQEDDNSWKAIETALGTEHQTQHQPGSEWLTPALLCRADRDPVVAPASGTGVLSSGGASR